MRLILTPFTLCVDGNVDKDPLFARVPATMITGQKETPPDWPGARAGIP